MTPIEQLMEALEASVKKGIKPLTNLDLLILIREIHVQELIDDEINTK